MSPVPVSPCPPPGSDVSATFGTSFFEIFGLEWERAHFLHPAFYESEDAWRAAGAPKEHVFGDSAYKAGTQGSPHFTFTSGYRVLDFLLNKAVIIAAPQPKPSLNGLMLQEVTWRAQWLAGTGGMTVTATCDEAGLQA